MGKGAGCNCAGCPVSRVPRAGDVSSLAERARSGEFSDSLGPYPAAEAACWADLVLHVTPDCLHRAGIPPGALVVAGDEDLALLNADRQIVPYFEHAARTARFAPVRGRRVMGMTPEQVMAKHRIACFACATAVCARRLVMTRRFRGPHGMVYQVTHFNTLHDLRLQHVLTEHYGGHARALLGEFELAFVLFIFISSLEALEQWKALLHMARA